MLQDQPGKQLPHRPFGRFTGWIAGRIGDLSVWSDIRAFPSLAIWGGVHCVAGMLWIRRSADAGSLKLTPTQIWVTATISALLLVMVRAMLARVEKHPPATWLRFVAACSSALPIVSLSVVSAKRLPFATAAYLCLLTFAVWGATWLWNRGFMEQLFASFLLSPTVAPANFARASFVRDAGDRVDNPQQRDESETLRLKRTAGIDGGDRLEGAMSAEFACGQAITTLHIPFLPTFSRAPALVCDVDKNTAVRIKGTAVYPYGCRVELKRSGNISAAARVEVRFSATLAPSLRAA